CNADCLYSKLHEIRGHKGQIFVASRLREILKDREIISTKKSQVQDPNSFRCIPQVHGATKDTFDFVLNTFLTEINSVTDNPNIFPTEDRIVSGGNFHGQPLALGLDFLSIAMSELANISERRSFNLLSGQRGLPLFLVRNPGLNSGLMIMQYTAAAIVSENKQLCTSASIDSISSSNNQEDHVSIGANAATKCYRVINNVEKVLAIELLIATQALEYRRSLLSSPEIEKLIKAFREKVPYNENDRFLHNDVVNTIEFLREYELE
ncbi:MAG: aromatic amino acid lyase, partial [Ginsengibacter sp.]